MRFLALAALLAAGCAGPQLPAAPPAAAQPAPPPPTRPAVGALVDPASAVAKAPEDFKVRFVTTSGDFIVEVHRGWAPNGADRFYNLVKIGFFDGAAFFRNLSDFMVQFGISGDPAISAKWRGAAIPDDPPAGQSNHRGALTFATAGPNSRTTQLFVNFGDNEQLDSKGFTPIGQVVEGMENLRALYNGYGEGAPSGSGPNQGRVQMEGNAYLQKEFPLLDYVKTAAFEP